MDQNILVVEVKNPRKEVGLEISCMHEEIEGSGPRNFLYVRTIPQRHVSPTLKLVAGGMDAGGYGGYDAWGGR
jgi:hypothetical protein